MCSTTTTADPPPQPPPQSPLSPTETLSQITALLTELLPLTHSITTFTSRWQVLRSKLTALKPLLSQISHSSHWSHNPLLLPILPNLLQTLTRLQSLAHHSRAPTRGKLLMQSDLDMAANWLDRQINDLDMLIHSGVLHHSTAIVLSRPDTNSTDELAFFVKDLFARIQIGGLGFKRKALESLIELLSVVDNDKSAAVVAKEGRLSCLISLLDVSWSDSVRELAVLAVTLLVSAGEFPRKCVFEEGALGPLVRIMEGGSMPMREKAAMAVECITSDPDNAWAISAYGGIPVLVELCRSGSLVAQSHAVGAIRNVSSVEDIRVALAEEGAVPVLVQLLVSGSALAQGKTAGCVAILASAGEYFQGLLLREKGLQRLLQLFHECPDCDTLEHVLRAIYSLSSLDECYSFLSGSTTFVMQLAEVVKHGNVMLQHIAASLLANLPIGEGNKRAVGGCMGSLVKLMECLKPEGMQEVGAKALLSLLSVKYNRKELVEDEKSLMRLVQMLDVKNEVPKKFPVAVVAAIMAGGSHGCRKKLMAAGAYGHLQRLAEMDVPGAKKALQRLSSNRLTSIFTRSWLD